MEDPGSARHDNDNATGGGATTKSVSQFVVVGRGLKNRNERRAAAPEFIVYSMLKGLVGLLIFPDGCAV